MPVGIAIISAAIITRQAIPASNLNPVNMVGNTNGRITVVRTVLGDAPNVSADLMSFFIHTFDTCGGSIGDGEEGAYEYDCYRQSFSYPNPQYQ